MGAAYLQKTFVKGVRGKRLKNDGTLPTILIENNHPAIVTKEVWLAANEKLKQKAIQYQSQVQYDEKREGKICFNKSIYSGLFMCGKCGKNYNFKINNRGKASESRIFHCASNRERTEHHPDIHKCDCKQKRSNKNYNTRMPFFVHVFISVFQHQKTLYKLYQKHAMGTTRKEHRSGALFFMERSSFWSNTTPISFIDSLAYSSDAKNASRPTST